ncbi:MAG: hypothetical protein FWH37_09605 [Candidatus Bathyarchaeota archaeon]|nr:hypothetical protein [Candidatus Termiticorpusculum sp.]
MVDVTVGNCYVCGVQLGKVAIKNHVLKMHANEVGGEECYLFKIEGACDKRYWLLVDVALGSSLSVLDSFLRRIWLDCCGHLSRFHFGCELGKSRKIGSLCVGDKIMYEYDFGSTTELLLTIVGVVRRPKQCESVRLLARNVPLNYVCVDCGKSADYVCTECLCDYDAENPFFCKKCCKKHGETHDGMELPITNSPRMGVCGYCGDGDVWTFNSVKLKKP